MNRGKCGRKGLWPNLRHYHSIFRGMEENHGILRLNSRCFSRHSHRVLPWCKPNKRACSTNDTEWSSPKTHEKYMEIPPTDTGHTFSILAQNQDENKEQEFPNHHHHNHHDNHRVRVRELRMFFDLLPLRKSFPLPSSMVSANFLQFPNMFLCSLWTSLIQLLSYFKTTYVPFLTLLLCVH